ncbi:hypothetical protein [Streptomyces sp.]|uniref:hypothetical protein n=1 Tax=Streptomyces sp. TaxID=1931 RepID=UPI00281150CE|nr:hypothetical protein [Streptomyces sp.]
MTTNTTELSAEQRAAIAGLIGDAKPATGDLLKRLAASVRDRREHEHPTWEDLFCLNLVSWMGERMAPVLRRLLDAETRVGELEADLAAKAQDAEAAVKGWGRSRERVAELEAAPTTVYRAEHPDSGITLGHYRSIDAAHQHCETLARREGATGLVSWVPDDGDALSPEELTFFDVEYCDGDDVPVQTCTGYVVTPLEVASEYDEEADE